MTVEAKKTKQKRDGRTVKWLHEHVNYNGTDCLIWPFSRIDGYGNFGLHGVMHYAHRYMCELVNGPAPSDGHMAAHNCGNGAGGCVHPCHVAWKTWQENSLDRIAHGTQANGKRGLITLEQAQQIRALRGIKTQAEIAKMFGVSRSNVGYVQRGRTHTNPNKGTIVQGDRFAARIGVDGKTECLGSFDTRADAAAAYQARLAEILNVVVD